MLPDMLMDAQPAALAQAIAAYDAVGGNIIVVEPAPAGRGAQVRHRRPGETATGSTAAWRG